MPKIAASSVKEHHDLMFERLVDAAESILRANGGASLTASEVAARAGIARNSIYRYVPSVDDLRILVLERYLPHWQERAEQALLEQESAMDKLVALVDISLDMGAETGHQWLVDVLKSSGKHFHNLMAEQAAHGEEIRPPAVLNFHRHLAMTISALWRDIDPVNAEINSRITRSLVDCGLRALDDGIPLQRVKGSTLAALAALPGA